MKQARKRANMLHDPSHYVLQWLNDFASGGTDEAVTRRMLGL
ncbi:hypothetical protein [Brucella sp. 2716]|nr:hypothetical protein [Brucella sp. 2716]UWF59430.1 hypothetical protein NYO66_02600 [Brucella sp. 2716]